MSPGGAADVRWGPHPRSLAAPRLPQPPSPPAHSLFAFFVNVIYLVPAGGRKERAGCRKGQGHNPSRGVVRNGEEGREGKQPPGAHRCPGV